MHLNDTYCLVGMKTPEITQTTAIKHEFQKGEINILLRMYEDTTNYPDNSITLRIPKRQNKITQSTGANSKQNRLLMDVPAMEFLV